MKFRLRYILYLLIVLTSHLTFAQKVDVENYPFIDTNADTFVFYGSSESKFKEFTHKFITMIRGGQKQIHIIHFGDSHLQADLFTGQVRKNLQTFMPGLEGMRGMVTPFTKGSPDSYKVSLSSSWRSFNIMSASDKEHCGLWGTTAYTDQRENTITVNVNNRNPVKYDFNVMRIYHSPLTQEDNISLPDIETAYSKSYHKQEGYTEFVFASYIEEVKINITKNSSDNFYLYGFYFANDNDGVVYNVTGTNGASAQSYLNAERLTSQLKTLPADMIIVSLGTNDTYEAGGENTFKDNLSAFVHKIRSVYSDIPIVLTTPVECYWHRKYINPRQTATVNIIRSVAEENSCIYMDMYTVLGGKGSSDKLLSNGLMQQDRVHLTAKGYQLQGDLFYNALWGELEKKF